MKIHGYIIKSISTKIGLDNKYSLINARTREVLLNQVDATEIKKYIDDNDVIIIAGKEYL